jgi:ferredoxin--NADP+ reductase
MNEILYTEKLSADVFLMRVSAPLIAEERKPGQFVIVSVDMEYGERIPLTIADADTQEGSITLIYQRVGATTSELAEKAVGDEIAVVGPLGKPTEIKNYGTVVCVAGGIGAAPMHPIVQGMKKAGNKIITILGARNKDLIVYEDQMRALSDELMVCTDDGSAGHKGLVTELLKEVCERDPKPDLAVAIGPPIMMKFCAETTRPYDVHTFVSLNTIMVDGTGMCGGCRVTVGGESKFVCVDGPEFDGHKVDFDGMMRRQQAYRTQEGEAMKCRQDEPGHQCTCGRKKN